jgi:cytochrome b
LKTDVWSWKIRLFHLLLVVSVATAFLTEDFEKIHEIVGYTTFLLVLWRVFYGFYTEDRYAKISQFFHKPSKIVSFFKSVLARKEERYLGHNPLAGAVMFTILITLLLSAISGASGFAMKEEEGFLSLWIGADFQLGELLLELHEISSNFILLLIAIHLSGVVVSSLLTRENLAKSIFTDGKKREE